MYWCSSPHAHTPKQLEQVDESESEYSEEEEDDDKVISFRNTQGEKEEEAEEAEEVCSLFQLLSKHMDISLFVCLFVCLFVENATGIYAIQHLSPVLWSGS